MNRLSRFTIAILLVGLLVLTGAGVWAAPRFNSTVPHPPSNGQGTCERAQPIDMDTAIFSPLGNTCNINVDRDAQPAIDFAPVPESLGFDGDAFKVTLVPDTEKVQICYAYPPELEAKDAKLYKLDESVTPSVWAEVKDAVISNGQICATNTSGIYALIGK